MVRLGTDIMEDRDSVDWTDEKSTIDQEDEEDE